MNDRNTDVNSELTVMESRTSSSHRHSHGIVWGHPALASKCSSREVIQHPGQAQVPSLSRDAMRSKNLPLATTLLQAGTSEFRAAGHWAKTKQKTDSIMR